MATRRYFICALACITGLMLASRAAAAVDSSASLDSSETLFNSRRLLEVRIDLATNDWEKLRREHRDLIAELGPNRFDRPAPNPYQTYRATVTIDGETVANVGVRKRGFIGSASLDRPSLGLRFDAYENQRRFRGLRRMSLNNNLQDPSQMRQMLAYRIFAAAGVPAPRCSLAKVTVNGRYLGIYSHVEAVEDEFLERHFGDARGNLYEGQISDFRPDWVKTFERKKNKQDARQDDLAAVVKALEAEDADLSSTLAKVVDLEAYRRFWAVESLIGHWDSYSKGGNNFFIYRRSDTGKFVFIPWGADAVLGSPDPFTQEPVPASVLAGTLLPFRLYQIPTERNAYRQTLRQILKSAWDEADLLIEVERLRQLVRPHLHVRPSSFNAAVSQIRFFIRARRAELDAELNGPAPEWPLPLRNAACLKETGAFSASFNVTWNDKFELKNATPATLTVEARGQKQTLTFARMAANRNQHERNHDDPTLTFLGGTLADARLRIGVVVVQPDFFKPGKIKLDGFESMGLFIEAKVLDKEQRFLGFLIGDLELKAAGTDPGDAVQGKISAEIFEFEKD